MIKIYSVPILPQLRVDPLDQRNTPPCSERLIPKAVVEGKYQCLKIKFHANILDTACRVVRMAPSIIVPLCYHS